MALGLKNNGSFLSERFADFFEKHGSRSLIITKLEINLRIIVQHDMIWGNSTNFHHFQRIYGI